MVFHACSGSGGSSDSSTPTPVDVTGVTLEQENRNVQIGGQEQLVAHVSPSNADDTSVIWTSNDDTVASVNNEGIVTANSAGITSITVTTSDGGFTDTCTITTRQNIQLGNSGESMEVSYLPANTLPTGEEVASFWMSRTEMTFKEVAEVLQYAYDNNMLSGGTVDSNTATLNGQELVDLDSTSCYIHFSGGNFNVETGFEEYPCTEISWYGSIMVCNWLTAMVNGGDTTEQYYTWLDDNNDTIMQAEEIYCDDTKPGFRLPFEKEWLMAARYIGTTPPATGDDLDTEVITTENNGTTHYWLPENYVSGAVADADIAISGMVAWFKENSDTTPNSDYHDGAGTHIVGTAGSDTPNTSMSGNPNHMGFFDMSGNLFEFCFDELMGDRLIKGCSWYNNEMHCTISVGLAEDAANTYYQHGLRLAKNSL